MSDFWKWFLDWWPAISAGVTGAVLAVTTYVVYRFKLRTEKAKNKALSEALAKAEFRDTYTNCPICGGSIKLKDCHWHLPNGSLDDNLNGVPDDQEDLLK